MALPTPGVTPGPQWATDLNAEILGRPQVSSFATTATWREPLGMMNEGCGTAIPQRMLLQAVLIPTPLILDGLGCAVDVAGSGDSTVELVVYADNGSFKPGARVATTGAISTSAGGGKAGLFSDVALPAGLYYVGHLPVGTTGYNLHAGIWHRVSGWGVNGFGTGSAPSYANGNTGTQWYQTGITSAPSTFAGDEVGHGNPPHRPAWLPMRLRRA